MTHKASSPARLSLMQRSLAAYYRAGGSGHPDPHMFGHFIAEYDVGGGLTGFREYVRLAHTSGTLAVFQVCSRSNRAHQEELKRLRRWPDEVEAGTAMTIDQFNLWHDGQLKHAGACLGDEERKELNEVLEHFVDVT